MCDTNDSMKFRGRWEEGEPEGWEEFELWLFGKEAGDHLEDAAEIRRILAEAGLALVQVAHKPAPAAPNCGACPGDGGVCESRCRVEDESPPAASEGMTLVPVDHAGKPKITNEMKAACIGEFHFRREATCPVCYSEESDDDCEVCKGEVEYMETIQVPWDTCKQIYKAMASIAMTAAPNKTE